MKSTQNENWIKKILSLTKNKEKAKKPSPDETNEEENIS